MRGGDGKLGEPVLGEEGVGIWVGRGGGKGRKYRKDS